MRYKYFKKGVSYTKRTKANILHISEQLKRYEKKLENIEQNEIIRVMRDRTKLIKENNELKLKLGGREISSALLTLNQN